ncbi:related to carbohydrate kinase, contains PfkB domain [Cephalotrichum gorgonifer]|uniref:Related to carbohydrate kinase, contains PfkB domain n=1 Tax=Cephalotrichum gorgonifer TaxID=2041049 RepID=A0AAE8MVK8_9PEZI|nr:related to carbohydrate kinase, contains PfkB domain [Cephalotrichum gorgonifer]
MRGTQPLGSLSALSRHPNKLACRLSLSHGSQLPFRPHGPSYPRSPSPSQTPWQSRRCLSSHNLGNLKKILRISDEVSHAIASNKPVVALESTIYTHGALGEDLGLEAIVREHGGVPAVIGILDGVPTVGLTREEVSRMVDSGTAGKVSRRDIAYFTGKGILGRGMHGGTTISGTMVLARLAGIRVFGTGGLGGVHRGGHDSMDVSADLTELGRTRVAVVSSGCKGFLDIPRTLEFLETQGAAVATFADGRPGKVDFPAFWARESGTPSPMVVQDEKEAAAIIYAQETLGIESGLLFANPIPEEFAIPSAEMAAAIETAVREAAEGGYTGSKNTPFVLSRIRELTGGKSVGANIGLVRSNVARASRIASELSKLIGEKENVAPFTTRTTTVLESKEKPSDIKKQHAKADILVAGAVALDLNCDYAGGASGEEAPKMQTSNPSRISQSIGGVGHNVALAAHLVSKDTTVRLCSMVGDDVAGSTVLSALEASGLDTSYVRKLSGGYHSSSRTAQYVAVNDGNKNLVMAMADMGIFTHHSFPEYWKSAVAGVKPGWLVVDGNWSEKDIRAWVQAGKENKCSVAFEPVSTAKATRLFCPQREHSPLRVYPDAGVDMATPNNFELQSMFVAARENGYFDDPAWFGVVDALGMGMSGARQKFMYMTNAEITDAGIPQQSIQLLPYIPTIITKLGSKGVLLTGLLRKDDPRLRDPECEQYILSRNSSGHPSVGGVYMRLFPAAEKVQEVVSVNGVGDTFLGVMIAGLAMGGRVEGLVDVAQRGAVMSLKSREAVSPDLGYLDGRLREAVERK